MLRHRWRADGASITTFPFVFALDGRKEENDDGVSLVTERDERSMSLTVCLVSIYILSREGREQVRCALGARKPADTDLLSLL